MRFLVGLLFLYVGFSFAAKAPQVLWIESEVLGSWDNAEWFRDEIEHSLNGFQGFQVIPRKDVAEKLRQAQLDPNTRGISASKMQDSLFPANLKMTLRISPPVHVEKRTPVLFFMGRRTVRMQSSFSFLSLDSSVKAIGGELIADTTFGTGYCGILECRINPQGMQDRLEMEKSLFRKLIQQIRGRLEQLIEIPAAYKQKQDSLNLLKSSSVLAESSSSAVLSSSSK